MPKSSKRPTKLEKAEQRAWDSLNLKITQAVGKFLRIRRLKFITWKGEAGKSFFPEKVAPVVKVAKPSKPQKPKQDPAAVSYCHNAKVIYSHTDHYGEYAGRRRYVCYVCCGYVSIDGHRIVW